jgi:Preprotein translocase subunit SecB.
MDIDISSTVLKNKTLEINTKLTLQDKTDNNEKSFFEIKYATVITIDNSITDKNLIGRIVLCDLQKIIYPKIENIFLNLIKNSGYPEIKFERKVDFEKLYSDKFN